MKIAGNYFALVLATTLGAIAQTNPVTPADVPLPAPAAVEPASKLSPSVAQQLTDKLPKYTPPAPAPEAPLATSTEPANTPNPEVLQLEKVKVTPRKRPRLNDSVMMTSSAFNDKLAKEKLSSFDQNFLNKFTLPSWLSGVSAAERAREEYNREQREQMKSDTTNLARAVEINDPEQAKALREAAARP